MRPAGYTPLSETFYEAHQYLSGGRRRLRRGITAIPGHRRRFPERGGVANRQRRRLPPPTTVRWIISCQKTFIVYLTDGLPTKDTESSDAIAALPDFATDGFVAAADGGGGADVSRPRARTARAASQRTAVAWSISPATCSTTTCEASVRASRTSPPTSWVSASTIAESADYLEDIATAGGGKSYTQNDAAGLTAALEEIFADVEQNANSTFVSPTVAVNAFNRTRNLNTLFVSVFAPTNRAHWPGNVKKYQLIDGVIHGTDTSHPGGECGHGLLRRRHQRHVQRWREPMART